MRVGGADVLDAEDVDEELGQFEDALHPVPPQVRDAGRGRRHDGFVAREYALEALYQRAAVIGITRIRVQLPATSLRFRELHRDAEALQQLDDRPARPGE